MAVPPGTISVRVHPLQGNGMDTYCKITQYADGVRNLYTFSFGTGRGPFWLVVSLHGKDTTLAYLDRVERVEKCSKGATKIVEMVKVIQLGLYAIKRMCPWVKRFIVRDDSHVISGSSIRLAYDSLLTHNMTWYQKEFGARLEGMVEAGAEKADGDAETFSSPGFQVHAVKGSFMYQFLKSLEVLDQPCKEFGLICDLLPELEYQEYEHARSPRDFLLRVRSQFPDLASFCHGVSSWFDRYMGSLRIQLFMDSWFIPVEEVKEPDGFLVGRPVKNVLNSYRGGTRRIRRVKRGQTRSRPLQGMVSGIDGTGMGTVE